VFAGETSKAETTSMNTTHEALMAMIAATFAAVMLVSAQLFIGHRNRSEATSPLWNSAMPSVRAADAVLRPAGTPPPSTAR
jgi:hypothetical protein